MKKKNIKNKRIKSILSNQKGMALLTTLIFVFILVTFAVALLTMTSNDTKLSTLQRDSTKAFYLAETGIDKALWYLNTFIDNGGKGLDWPTDDGVEITEGTSVEYYEAIVKYEPIGQNEIISIVSTGVVKEGTYSSGKRKIKVIAKKEISPSYSLAYNYAIFAELIVTLIGSLTVVGDIHSNGIIDGSVNIKDIYGEITTGGNELYPIIKFDYYKQLAIKNGTYYGDNTSKIFNINETITGIHFIDGDVEIKGNTILNIHNGAIFATGKIVSRGTTEIHHTKDETYDNPLALVAQGDIDLGGNVFIQGVIQSNSTITIGGTDSVLNSAVYAADTVKVNGTPTIIYDPDLQGKIIPGTGIEIYKRISWQEVY
ncbi:hypothetical protein KJ599_02455 [bacterium]|nr:hypothetical protein [bacterium]